MKILKNGDVYFNLSVLDAYYFLDYNNSLNLGSGDNQRELELDQNKYQEFKTKLFDFLINSEIVMDISTYVLKG
jgi:hypothetical protein